MFSARWVRSIIYIAGVAAFLVSRRSSAIPQPSHEVTPYSYQESLNVDSPVAPERSILHSDLSSAIAPQTSADLVDRSTIDRKRFDAAINDVEGRISKSFRIPPDLKNRVEFWLRVYTLYGSEQVIIFDELHPEIVYEVVDFTDLKNSARSKMVYAILRERRIKALVQRYRIAFERLRKYASTLEHRDNAAFKVSKKPKKSPRIPRDFPNTLELRIYTMSQPVRSHDDVRHDWTSLRKSFRVQTGQRDAIANGLPFADVWLGRMESIFESIGTPPELTRIGLVESSFNPQAVSRVGAVGIWQFMEAPAKSYLILDPARQIDERRSPLKAGIAAAKMLKDNNKILKYWPLSVTAYHSGMRPFLEVLRRKLAKSQFQGIFDPCGSRSRLGWAGQNYYSEFLAILYAEKYRDWFYGLPRTVPKTKVRMQMLSRETSLAEIAALDGFPLPAIAQLNPDVKRLDTRLPPGFFVVLPSVSDDWAVAVATNWVQLVKQLNLDRSRGRLLKKSGITASKKAKGIRST